jgi:hypothetical protein
MPQLFNLLSSEVTLFRFQPQSGFSDTFQYSPQILYVSAKHQDVIKVDDTDGPGQPSQYNLHQALKGPRSIHQAKWHLEELIEARIGYEGCFLLGGGVHPHLPVTGGQVQCCEISVSS